MASKKKITKEEKKAIEVMAELIKEEIQDALAKDAEEEQQQEAADKDKAEDGYISVAEVAAQLKISKTKVYDLLRKGKIRSQKKGNKYLITQQDIEDYAERLRMEKIAKIIYGILVLIAVILMYVLGVEG